MKTYRGKIKTSKTLEKKLRGLIRLNTRFQNEILSVAIETAEAGPILSTFDLIVFDQNWDHFKDLPSDIKNKTCQRVAKSVERWIFPDASGRRFGRPRFKSPDKKRQSFSFPIRETQQGQIKQKKTEAGFVVLHAHVPGIGILKARMDGRQIEGTIKQIAIVQDACGDFWMHLTTTYEVCELLPKPLCQSGGADLGLKHTVTVAGKNDEGNLVVVQPVRQRFFDDNCSRLVNASRRKNYRGLAHVHRKIARQRRDSNRKLAHEICLKFGEIYVGDVSSRWLFSGKLARSAADCAHFQLKTCIAAKASKTGRKYKDKVPEKYTSSICHYCQKYNGVQSLSDREIACISCGYIYDRDVNAALNIALAGKELFNFDLSSVPPKSERLKAKRPASRPSGTLAGFLPGASKIPTSPVLKQTSA